MNASPQMTVWIAGLLVVSMVACDRTERLAYQAGRIYSIDEAEALCAEQIGGSFDQPLIEVATDAPLADLEVQLFHTIEFGWRPAFVLHRGNAIFVGDGHIAGVQSVVMADLDHDGHTEVVLSYDQSSGKWNQFLWSYEPATGEIVDQRMPVKHPVNLHLVNEPGGVGVYSTEFDNSTYTFSKIDPARRLGRLERTGLDGGQPFQIETEPDAPPAGSPR